MDRRQYLSITPEDLAILQLNETVSHLRAADLEPLRLLLAAKSLHAAMVAALTAALAGSSGTGAYDKRVRERWLAFLESEREAVVEIDLPQRVLRPADLLTRAREPGAIEWATEPFACSDDERSLIDRLTFIRDELEHPKPMLNSFEAPWVAVTFLPAAQVTQQCLNAVAHHLDRPEDVRSLISDIITSARRWLPSSQPS